MIDLTPLDVRKKRGDFSRGIRGYDPDEVDSFLELVAERLEHLVKENLTLKERTDRLGDQVRSQEGRERAVQEALVTAQELREDILGQARREADLMQREAEGRADEIRREVDADAERLRRESREEADRALTTARKEADRVLGEARGEAERAVGEARRQIAGLQETLQELDRRRARFLKSFRALLERELGDVEVEEGRTAVDEIALEIDLPGGRRTGHELTRAEEPGAEGTPDEDDLADVLGATPQDGSPRPDAIVDVADIAPTDDGETAPANHDPAGQDAVSEDRTWTSTLVYDDGDEGQGDDAADRGN